MQRRGRQNRHHEPTITIIKPYKDLSGYSVLRLRLRCALQGRLLAIDIARVYGEQKRSFVRQHFWARGYWVSTVGHNEAAVRLYIQEQEKEDQRLDQLGLFGGEGRLERLQD